MLHPRLLDLNQTLVGMGHLIRQLMGADREVTFGLSPDAGMVYADEGQLEQVILNLALNARDAMSRGGRFTITTTRERLGSEFAALHPGIEIRPGDYARMTIADTGEGMHPQTLVRAFEPFFTTKPVGEGSGLGLATVYGIVKQSNGYIWGESDPSVGTSWYVYLPLVSEPARTPSDHPEPAPLEQRQRDHPGRRRRTHGARARAAGAGDLRLHGASRRSTARRPFSRCRPTDARSPSWWPTS